MRIRENFDFDWMFHKGDLDLEIVPKAGMCGGFTDYGCYVGEPSARQYIDEPAEGINNPGNWIKLDIPHDWAVETGYTSDKVNNPHASSAGYMVKGIGCYRKAFKIPAKDFGKKIFIEFDGVFRNSTVWVNGFYMGKYASGYMGFYYDITDVLRYGNEGTNLVLVRVDATEREGWWYEGAGIYRHVWLMKTDYVYIGRWGVHVTARSITNGRAEVNMRTKLVNENDETAKLMLTSAIVDAMGNTVAKASVHYSIPPLGMIEPEQAAIIDSPKLWSVDDPVLYTLLTEVSIGNAVVDTVETTFGVRTIEFTADRGFFLNGVHTPIKGMCVHQDFAGVGIGLPDRINEYRVRLLKDMGCNAYRTAHHPPAPELLDICDRLGMLVMCENRILGSSPDYLENLTSMIRRDRNHPSVIMWSLENEEEMEIYPQGARILKTMKNAVRRLDDTRPVTAAMAYNTNEAYCAVQDVLGYNYGLESRNDETPEKCPLINYAVKENKICGECNPVTNVDNWVAMCQIKDHHKHPDWKMIGSEVTSGASTRGVYEFDPVTGYCPEYGATWRTGILPEDAWKPVLEYPYLTGIFVWTGFDYRGESFPMQWPTVMAQLGAMDICGFPKDKYYYYQSAWTEAPMVHIFPHWNWPGRDGKEIEVWSYSNCDSVELFLNGESLGVQKVIRGGHMVWKVKYAPGELSAIATKNGVTAAKKTVITTGAPYKIFLAPDRSEIKADRRDISIIKVSVLDAQGNAVPNADNDIVFTLEGNGIILGLGNGDPACHDADKPYPVLTRPSGYPSLFGRWDDEPIPMYKPNTCGRRRVFNGHCMVIIQSGEKTGSITIKATSPSLLPASTTIGSIK